MQTKIRVPRSLLLCMAKSAEEKERIIAEQAPGAFALVKEIRRVIAEGKTVIALTFGAEGKVNYCYAIWQKQETPCWYVSVTTRETCCRLDYNVLECRFFYKDEKDRLKEIKGKVA